VKLVTRLVTAQAAVAAAIGFETAFVMFGHTAVARSFSGVPAQAEGPVEAGADAFGGRAAG
jgi:hypothetical protein